MYAMSYEVAKALHADRLEEAARHRAATHRKPRRQLFAGWLVMPTRRAKTKLVLPAVTAR